MHTISQEKTLIYLVRTNILLLLDLYGNSDTIAFNLSNEEEFYISRAKHLQFMMVIGITAEQLVKLILIKRGISVESDLFDKATNLKKTISFDKAIDLFLKSSDEDYFNIKGYEFNEDDVEYEYIYLGYKQIKPKDCINVIRKMRNNYIHAPDPLSEMNGIIWYLFNFLIWLSNKEFKDYFNDFNYIGNNEIKSLFN